MANVTDSNFWQPIPLSDPKREAPASQPPLVPPDPHDAETWRLKDRTARVPDAGLAELSRALRHHFDSGRDQIYWNAMGAQAGESVEREPYLRIDPRHGSDTATDSAHVDSKAWLIIVERARDLVGGNRVGQLQAAREQSPHWLLIACDGDETDSAAPPEEIAATSRQVVEMSDRLHCEYVGPITRGDLRSLVGILARIKELGRPTVLHLKTRGPIRPDIRPHVTVTLPAPSVGEEILPSIGSFPQTASQELARLARHDARIMAVSTSVDPILLHPWESMPERIFRADLDLPHALEWSANLASSGSRPFMFLSWEEAQNVFGQIRQDICLPRAPVTLIIEPRGETAAGAMSSSVGLAGIRQLPNISVLSPKDGMELRQMLEWCASQGDPAVVWLPQAIEPPVTWKRGSDIVLGRAEQLTDGSDVAIVAWGPMVAAAAVAAERLAQFGITAAVVNARFAQPLDLEAIARAVHGALCVVVVSDDGENGGFSGWVLEQLISIGMSQPVSIVGPEASSLGQHPHDVHNHCALAIVDRCRWLSAPVLTNATIKAPLPPATGLERKAAAGKWSNFVGTHGDAMARERAQVYTRQLSADARRWVSAYEKVGARDVYLWKWCMHGVALTTLPCVVPELRAHVCDTKLLSIVLCVLLDDVADQHGDSRLLDALLKLTCLQEPCSLRGFSAAARRHAELTRSVWAEYQARTASYPCYTTFEPVLRYDLLQFFNTMRYSHLVNGRPYLLNTVEHDLYTSHNMMMVSFAMLDLMCSPGFPRADVGALRETIWHAQCMGRIGNLLSTWRRELADRDFTSGVFARSVMEGDLTLDELEHGDPAQLEATICGRGHEAHFFQKWLAHREQCHARAARIGSLDLRSVLDGHDRFLAMHLGSQGLI